VAGEQMSLGEQGDLAETSDVRHDIQDVGRGDEPTCCHHQARTGSLSECGK
jgi:hypothetical protein